MKNESHLVGKELGIVLISGILITNWGKGDGSVMLNVWYNFANNVRVYSNNIVKYLFEVFKISK